MRHLNIPVFIPHLGCPNQCVFCNQRSISGVNAFDPKNLVQIIDKALSTVNPDDDVEIAFFGGSFTGIDRGLMIDLLTIAHTYIEDGRVNAIRCSTRPDYISAEIIDILKRYGVRTIELGLQSCSDEVLALTKRGHSFVDEQKACKLIVDSGIELVGQMMIGLPESDRETELSTADFIIKSGATGARIYPTIVFTETELCQMTSTGVYTPLTLDEAIERSVAVFERFVDAGVDVIRIGLHSSENLSNDKFFAGPNHPALGELVIGEYYYRKISKLLKENNFSLDEKITVYVSRGSLSKAIGQNGKNKKRLMEKYKFLRFAEAEDHIGYDISVKNIYGENKCI